MAALNCKTVADLQKVEPRKLADKVGELFGIYQVLGWSIWPERDGKLLPKDGWQAYADGKAKDIEILAGCTKDEFNTFAAALGVDGWNMWAADRMAKRAKLLTAEENAKVESYISSAPGEEWEKTCSMFSQSYFNAPAIRMSENQAKAGGKIYTYFYTPESILPMVKSGHASELSVVFNHPEMTGFTGRPIDETFSKTLRKMWVQFAKTGNPSLSAEISPDGKEKLWPLYDLTDKQIMVFDEFNIHSAKEADVKMVDWDNTYFLTKLYCN
jgi:para-nitrobenzyl esterase